MSNKKTEKLIKELILSVGEDIGREGLKETPKRVANSFGKIFEGYGKNSKELITVFSNEGYDEMVIMQGIDFYSVCEHHILPFYGKVSIGYLPKNKLIGLSKLPRLVSIYSRRLQNQERLTKQIADDLNNLLKPKGVGVVVTAEHFCMRMRGIEKQNCVVSTSTFTGLLKENIKTRSEFINLIK